MKDTYTGSNIRATSASQCDLLRFSTDNLRRYRNSATAARLWQARVPFESAMLAILDGTAQPTEVIAQLSHSYKLDERVVTIPKSLVQPIIDLVQKYLATNQDDADALFVLANLPGAAGQPEWNVQQLDHCIQLNPNEAAFYFARAKLKLAMQDVTGAVHDYQACVDLNPLDYLPLYMLGSTLARLAPNNSHAASGAKRALRSYIEAAPRDAEHLAAAYYELASLSLAAGDLAEMKELYEKGKVAEQHRLHVFRPVQSAVRDTLAAEVVAFDADAIRDPRFKRKNSSERLRDATFHALTSALLIIG